MKPTIFVSILCLLTLAHAGTAPAQPDEWIVITTVPDTFRSCTIGEITDERVNLIRPGEVVRVHVDSIDVLVRRIDSRFWTGAGIGALTGGALGAIIGAAAHEEPDPGFHLFEISRGGDAFLGGMLGGIGGFVVGGLIGGASGGEERLDLSGHSQKNKLIILRQLRDENR